MAATFNYVWEQGEDLIIRIVYKEGPEGAPVAVDLTGYSLRMDMRKVNTDGIRVWTFNSDDIIGEPLADDVGAADNEITLGADGSIEIVVSRLLTLPGGSIFTELQAGTTQFVYDMFLRNPQDQQKKILTGVISINKSITLWS